MSDGFAEEKGNALGVKQFDTATNETKMIRNPLIYKIQ